jgi:hypothetical protein
LELLDLVRRVAAVGRPVALAGAAGLRRVLGAEVDVGRDDGVEVVYPRPAIVLRHRGAPLHLHAAAAATVVTACSVRLK